MFLTFTVIYFSDRLGTHDGKACFLLKHGAFAGEFALVGAGDVMIVYDCQVFKLGWHFLRRASQVFRQPHVPPVLACHNQYSLWRPDAK